MTTIITRSSRYELEPVHEADGSTVGGYLTRISEIPVLGYDEVMVREPVLTWERPTPGAPWRYRTQAGPFITTTVRYVVDPQED